MPDLDVALRVRAQTQQAGRQVGDLRRRVRGLGTTTGRAAIQTRQFGAAWTNGTTALAGAQRRLVGIKTLIATLGIGLAIRAVVNSFADFEKGLIGVGKTANLNAAELALLGGNITALGSRLPVARAELLEIAEAAGQLGVKGVADLTLFAETVGKLGLASDLSGEEAATTLARILTVTKEGVGEVDRFASVIVDLGNNFAASEAEIAAMATRVAQATALFGVMSHEAAGMGAAMRAVGVEAEAGGTVVGRAFQAISDAVRNGGEELETIAKITGTTGAEVSRTFGDNATEAFRQFVVGLGRIKDEGGDVARTLTDLDLEGVRVIQVLGSMANNAEVLTDALRRANVEVEANQALNREAAVAAESFAAQMQLVKNDVNSASAVIGQELAPVILKLTDDFREWIKEAKRTGEIREFAEGLGDVFRVLAANMDLVVAAAGALVGLRLGSAFGPWGAAIGLVVGGLGSLIALSAAATEEIDIHKSAVERLAGALDDLAGPASRASEATRTEARANLDAAIAKERNYQATLKLREEQLRSTFPKLPENTVGRSDAEILAKLGLSPNRGPSGFLPIVVQNALDTARALRLVQTALAASKDAVANAQADAALIETGTNFRQRAPEVVAAPIVVAPPEAAPPAFRPIDLGRDGGRSLGELRTELERARRTFDAITSAAERARAQLGGTFSAAIQGALEFRDTSIAALRDIGEADSDLAAVIEAITRERISGAWQEEADRRADAHRAAAAEIEAIELDLGLRSVYDAAIADAMRWRDETRAALGEIGDDMGDLADRAEAAYARMVEAAEEARERQEIEAAGFIGGVRAALQDMAEESESAFDLARKATDQTFNAMEDALVDFVTTGKFSFSDFADHIIAELARIAIQRSITEPLEDALERVLDGQGGSIFSGLFSGGGGAGGGGNAIRPVASLHAGGVVGALSGVSRRVSPTVFAGAERYHAGGIAGLGAGEVPVIARRGEGILTARQLGDLARPPGITINFENRGTPQQETSRDVRFDGRGYIVQVVTEDVDNGGPIARSFERGFGQRPAQT